MSRPAWEEESRMAEEVATHLEEHTTTVEDIWWPEWIIRGGYAGVLRKLAREHRMLHELLSEIVEDHR